MIKKITELEVLTLEEAAEFLRLPSESVLKLVSEQGLPGRHVDGQWRFLKDAVTQWLRTPESKQPVLKWIGAFKDDPTLPEVVKIMERNRKTANKKNA